MDRPISRVRTRKTRARQQQADRAAAGSTSSRGASAAGAAIAGLFWLVVVVLLGWEALASGRTHPSVVLNLAGNGAILLVSLFATGVFLEIVRPGLLLENRQLLLMVLASALAVATAKGILYLFVSSELLPLTTAQFLLPFAVAPLLATILADAAVGIAVGVWTSLALALLAGGGLPAFIAGMVATVVTARMAGSVRTRSRVIRTGLAIGLSETLAVFALTALHWREAETAVVLQQAGSCLISGFVSALVVLLILPVFEAAFHLTSDITLLELSDLSHPLLQRLAIEAPGTYHHSLVVANLAQAAADEIGANGLLARVGAYFHDAGKLTKSEFFSENIEYRSNPHDTLPPSMSTLVITSHVKEGLSLAVLYKLPQVIRRAISEHHGTGVLSYFHHKAQERLREEPETQVAPPSNGKGAVDDAAFRYPGPRPSSRETAILCLADAVEAASRSATKTTPGHLKDLVQDIVNSRLIDGQLDNSGLTLNELDAVKRSFVFTLTSMLHGRVPYPKNESRSKQPAKTPPSERLRAKEAGPATDAPGVSSGNVA